MILEARALGLALVGRIYLGKESKQRETSNDVSEKSREGRLLAF